MEIVRDPSAVPGALRGAAAAIGNFDGVHLGHRAVIDAAKAAAGRLGAPLGVVTFDPHPRAHFAPGAPPFRLMSAEARAHLLEKLGIQVLFELPFGPVMAAQPAEDFARQTLGERLGLSHLVAGADFRFGRGRAGDVALLQRIGPGAGYAVTVAPMVDLGGEEISSTRIRDALSQGRPRDAARLLGHVHRIEGEVIHGAKRGRTLGFPTANVALDGLHLPRFGVYAVGVEVLDGPHSGRYRGAASLGVRPMYGGEAPNLETYLMDFSGDLYGAHLSVGLVEFLRPESTFPDLPSFLAAMARDVDEARAVLAA